MIRHLWSVLCTSSAIDRDTNKLSLFEVAEQMTLLEPFSEPGLLPVNLHLVTLWSRENIELPEKATVRVRLITPAGDYAGNANEYQVDLTTFHRLRQRLVFRMFPLQAIGVHEFQIEVRDDADQWREVAKVPLEINVKLVDGGQSGTVQ